MRGLLAGLAVLLTLLFPTAAATADEPVAHTIDQLIAQLRTDPVLVQSVFGTGDADGVHQVLTELADKVDAPVFVVLAVTPVDLAGAEQAAEQAAALLHEELGDGLYVIKFTDGSLYVHGWGAAAKLDTTPGSRATTRAGQIGPLDYNRTTSAFETELILRSAADPGRDISDKQLRQWIDTPRAFIPTDANDRADLLAQRWVFAISAAMALLITGVTLTRLSATYPMLARARPDAPAEPGGREASNVLVRSQKRFDRLSVTDLASSHAQAAREALDAARLVADTDDQLDEIGVWVLGLIADRELGRIRKPNQAAYRPCIVDPRHGEAAGTVRLVGSSIDAPACRRCSQVHGRFLTARTWRGQQPYLESDTIWARTGFGALVNDLPRQVIADRGRRR